MRILHLTEGWKGGIATYVTSLLEFQLNHPEIESVDLVVSDAVDGTAGIALGSHAKLQVRWYRSSRRAADFLSVRRAVRRIVESANPSIIHAHSSFPGAYVRSFSAPCPVVYCAHGWSFAQSDSLLFRWGTALIERALARGTAAVVCVSRFEMTEAWRRGVRGQCNELIYSGVREPAAGVFERPFPYGDRLNIGYFGRLDGKKGLAVLARAVGETRNERLLLHVFGDYESHKSTPRLEMLHDNARIRMWGWLDDGQIDAAMRLMDFVVLPSHYEALPLALLEAFRNERAVIVSTAGGMHEVVIDGVNGRLFSHDGSLSLARVLDEVDKETAVRMGAASGRIFREGFRAVAMNEKILALYRRVLA